MQLVTNILDTCTCSSRYHIHNYYTHLAPKELKYITAVREIPRKKRIKHLMSKVIKFKLLVDNQL